jgi:hypothetical protein
LRKQKWWIDWTWFLQDGPTTNFPLWYLKNIRADKFKIHLLR